MLQQVMVGLHKCYRNSWAVLCLLLSFGVSLTHAGGHENAVADNPVEASASRHVIIFGATRGVGFETAKLLVARGDKVTAFVRPSSDLSLIEPLGVQLVRGDAVVATDVTKAFEGADYTEVVTTMGCYKCEIPPDYIGNKHVFDAAKASGINRVIMVSTLGTGDTYDAMPWIAKIFLKDVVILKNKAEDHLKSLDLDYTILRPGSLADGPATGTGIMSKDAQVGIINRADVAALVLKSIDDDTTIKQGYVLWDTEKSWPWSMF